MMHIRSLALAALLFAALPALAEEAGPPVGSSELIQRFQVKEARQGVGVDADAFYAVDNTVIAKYDKKTGALVAKWEGDANGSAIHLDSAAVVDGKLYAAHSNYPAWPMTSSVEVWDAATMKHIESHSLGIERGSLTWLDRDANGVWWGAFANYNRVFDKSPIAYGNKYTTQLVRFDADWRVAEAWVYPDALVEKFDDMSNSGGAWGAGRQALHHRPRQSRALCHGAAQDRLRAEMGRHHPGGDRRAGLCIRPQPARRDLRHHPQEGRQRSHRQPHHAAGRQLSRQLTRLATSRAAPLFATCHHLIVPAHSSSRISRL